MYILGKRADRLEESDINRLLQSKTQESKSLDYKKELKITSTGDKKEFLYDISAMHNTEGGCIIFGIAELKDEHGNNTGIPNESIYGVNIENYDKLVQQIEDIIKNGTEPSISNILFNKITIKSNDIFVIGIPKNLGLPSMTIYDKTNKFYKRRNTGKYLVDVYELNQMFMRNQSLKDAVENFRLQRIQKIKELKVFPNLDTGAFFVMQIIPFSFLNDQIIDLTNIESTDIRSIMQPMQYYSSSGYRTIFNFDGYSTFSTRSYSEKIEGYDQLFRNGAYEIYTTRVFMETTSGNNNPNNLYDVSLIDKILDKTRDCLSVLERFEIEPPFFICMSFHGVLNGTIIGNGYPSAKFTTDEIILPAIVHSAYESDLQESLRPVFDILWQSVGESKAPIKPKP